MESGKWYLNRFLSNWGREGGTAIWPVSREDGERLTRGAEGECGDGLSPLARRWALLIFRSCEDAPITAN